MRELPECYKAQFESCTRIAVKREPVRLTGIERHEEPPKEEKFDLMKELSK